MKITIRAKRIFSNILLVIASMIATLLLIEICLRLFFPVSDIPYRSSIPGVGITFEPDQEGVWIVGATGVIRGHYRINSQGWNSTHDYVEDKADGTLRIAVIGDSFIEALQVNIEEAYPSIVEQMLEDHPSCSQYEHIEVYSFGVSGAPLSQYLSMMRYISDTYHPDAYVINIVHNDFEESLYQAGSPYYLTFKIEDDGTVIEETPMPYQTSEMKKLLGHSALVRYLITNIQINRLIPLLSVKRDARTDVEQHDSTPTEGGGSPGEIGPIDEESLIEHMLVYTFTEASRTAASDQAHLLLVMSSDYVSIGKGDPPSQSMLRYNDLVQEAASTVEVDLLDLTGSFQHAYEQDGLPFNSSVDSHWNAYGHHVVGEQVAGRLIEVLCQPE
jgi:hypothetical protein